MRKKLCAGIQFINKSNTTWQQNMRGRRVNESKIVKTFKTSSSENSRRMLSSSGSGIDVDTEQ